MKDCEVLIGPILGGDGISYHEGQTISLDLNTAEQFAWSGYVKILGDPKPSEPSSVPEASEEVVELPAPEAIVQVDEPPVPEAAAEVAEPPARKRKSAASED